MLKRKRKPKRRVTREEIDALLTLTANNCGTGAGGFKPGNKCARGGGVGKASSAVQDYLGVAPQYTALEVLGSEEFDARFGSDSDGVTGGTAAIRTPDGSIYIREGFESDATHELVHAAGTLDHDTAGSGVSTYLNEGITQSIALQVGKRSGLDVRETYANEVGDVEKWVIPATGLSHQEFSKGYVAAGDKAEFITDQIWSKHSGKFSDVDEWGSSPKETIKSQMRGFIGPTPHLEFIAESLTANAKHSHSPVTNAAKNPLKLDPSRTATERRIISAELTRRFGKLKKAIHRLLVEEDALGLGSRRGTVTSNAELILALNNCGTGAGGFKPGNKCAKGGSGGGFAASSMPSDMVGMVEVFDSNTGEVFTVVDADEARGMFKEELETSGSLEGLSVREAGKSLEEVQKQKQAEQEEFWKEQEAKVAEIRRIESLQTPHGIRPGHPDFVEPPDVLYHATFAADKIKQEGFKSGDELGSQTLGGTSAHLVSFTTKENAEKYRQGLDIARRSANGEIGDSEILNLAPSFGVSPGEAQKILDDLHPSASPETRSFNAWQGISFKGKEFPLFMGSGWPESVKSNQPPKLVGVPSKSLQDIYYNPGETEWRVGTEDLRGRSLIGNMLITNTRWAFLTETQKFEQFASWLQTQVDLTILARAQMLQQERDHWIQEYIQRVYTKGVLRAFDEVRRPALAKSMDFYDGTRREFLESSFGRAVDVERVKLLASRTFTELQGITESMAGTIRRELVDGMIRGESPRVVGARLNGVVDGYKNRGLTMARTETIRAHSEGALDAMEALGVEEIGVMVEWSTAMDDKVCPLCRPLEGIVMKTKEAHGMFPRHPSCRCTPVPANVGEDTKDQKRTKGKIQTAINKSLKAEGGKKRSIKQAKDRSKWKGADLNVSKKRPKSLI